MPHNGADYEFLFDVPGGEIGENAFDILRHDDVFRYRAKTIKSGDVLECEIFPVWNCSSELRAAKRAESREAQKNLNLKNAVKNLTRKINANFSPEDLHVTLTYRDEFLPDEEQARKDIRNYLRRVRAFRKKNNLSELKYVYVIEFSDGDGRRKRVHHHVIMSGMDRAAAKALWKNGSARADELQPEKGSLEGLARYITKQPCHSKRWQTSRNLKEPKITVSDTKISRRKAERLAEDMENEGRRIFSQAFPGYEFDNCAVKYSQYVAGAYIYAKMHKRPPAKKKQNRRL